MLIKLFIESVTCLGSAALMVNLFYDPSMNMDTTLFFVGLFMGVFTALLLRVWIYYMILKFLGLQKYAGELIKITTCL